MVTNENAQLPHDGSKRERSREVFYPVATYSGRIKRQTNPMIFKEEEKTKSSPKVRSLGPNKH